MSRLIQTISHHIRHPWILNTSYRKFSNRNIYSSPENRWMLGNTCVNLHIPYASTINQLMINHDKAWINTNRYYILLFALKLFRSSVHVLIYLFISFYGFGMCTPPNRALVDTTEIWINTICAYVCVCVLFATVQYAQQACGDRMNDVHQI